MREKFSQFKVLTTVALISGGLLLFLLSMVISTENVIIQQGRPNQKHVTVTEYTEQVLNDSHSPIGKVKVYSFPLEESYLKKDASLMFYTAHQYVDIYIDNHCVYRMRPSGNLPYIKTVGCTWNSVSLYREDIGKEVRVVITPAYEEFLNREVEFMIGSQHSVYEEQLQKDLPQLIISGLTVLVGVILLGLVAFHLYSGRPVSEIAALSTFSIGLGLWRFTDTRFSPHMMQRQPVVLTYISLSMLICAVIATVHFLMAQRSQKSRVNFWGTCCIIAWALCILQVVLQVLGIKDLRETIYITHGIIVIGLLIIIITVLHEYIKCRKNMVNCMYCMP